MKDKPLWKSKTLYVGLAGILAGIGAYFAGELDLIQLVQTEVVPFAVIFLRMAVGNK